MIHARAAIAVALVLVGAACSPADKAGRGDGDDSSLQPGDQPAAQASHAVSDRVAVNPLRNAYFGDLHVHTANSFDAYNLGIRSTPDDAYRYALGESIKHPLGYDIQLRGGALDFYAVSDHAEYMGVFQAMSDPDNPLAAHPLAAQLFSEDPAQRQAANLAFGAAMNTGQPLPGPDTGAALRSTWQANIDVAQRYNAPGSFTTFVAYEYSSTPDGANLHRNVIFEGGRAPEQPFGANQSTNPEDLWAWMDQLRAEGIEALAIPHNSNWSQGLMFERSYREDRRESGREGGPIDKAYAAQRMRNEPIVEITQVKGSSETHPALSPSDEWADFEVWYLNKTVFAEDGTLSSVAGETTGSYARDGLRTGLELQSAIGANPYQFGFIGSTDGHNAASPVDEDRYFGKIGRNDGTPQIRGSVPPDPANEVPFNVDTLEWGASGLAGVWAEENTRAALYAALRRKEVFATSGPRIKLRLFAGFDYPNTLASDPAVLVKAYGGGVPMGGELVATMDERAPGFLIWAQRDPFEAPLQRAQIVKGWLEGGKSQERVFDVACADGAVPDAGSHRCQDNGASVNLKDCSISGGGAAELRTLWRDPDFDPGQRAFYYLRVLQNPTCRWSTWDAVRAGVTPNPKVPATLQERAWSSPIWYSPMVKVQM